MEPFHLPAVESAIQATQGNISAAADSGPAAL